VGAPASGAIRPKIDVHTHLLPPELPDFAARYGYGGFVRMVPVDACRAHLVRDDGTIFRAVTSSLWSPTQRLAECDAEDVGIQVLSTVPVMFNYWSRPEDGLDLSQFLNDHLAGVVRAHPDRFVGLGTVPLQSPDLAAREMERCVRTLGFAGVIVGSHVNGWNLDEPALFPFFERAQALDAAVFVHPWEMMGKDAMPKYWLPWLVGMPAETSRAICSLWFGGVLERLPRLRVLFAHGGGSFVFTLGRIEHGYRVRPDLCATDTRMEPRDALQRIYVDSIVHDPRALRYLIDALGVERIALGSDYPFPLGEAHPGALIASLTDLTDSQRDRLYFGTAREFLGASVAPALSR
jgi:aminocarboxymuconate-semialdehyde decarboxylase